ncbi:MAG TPA: amino acid adenylation domain-containing protein [Thermoanaerobaculia bacterium]|nr:amino acid adenylation domain-containing protein [Thermoanaerobaculia bacterium]
MQSADIQGFELSPQQRHLWRLGRELEGAPLRVQAAWQLTGPLERARLAGALHGVVARYEILRTTFSQLPGLALPLQVVGSEIAPAGFREFDLRHLPGDEQERELTLLLRAARVMPLDLGRGPMLDAVLVALEPSRHLVLLTLPALCADRESLDHLCRELARGYGQGGAAWEDDPFHLADIAAWQDDLLASEAASAGKVHWQKQDLSLLGRMPSPLPVAMAGRSAFRPESVSAQIESETLERLRALAPDLPLDLCLLAGWQIALQRLSGAPNLLVGVRSPGRSYAELVEAVGPLARYLPMRLDLDPAGSFLVCARQVKAAWRRNQGLEESFSWDHLSQILEAGAGEPFFPFGFDGSAGEEAVEEWNDAGLHCAIHARYSCIDRFELHLSSRSNRRGVFLEIQFDATRFEPWQVGQLLERYLALLAGAARNPEAAVASLPLAGPIERHGLLFEANDTVTGWPAEARLEVFFEQIAQHSPEAVAASSEEGSVSYGELDARANRLAHHLRALGSGPETRVAICLDRSLAMLTGLLGILKAGAAYIPLDPEYPLPRLQFMLEDAGVAVLLTHTAFAGRLAPHAARLVLMDRDAEEIAGHPSGAPDGRGDVDGTAYVIYTSGSTGQPKGVMVSHRAIGNRLQWMRYHLALDAGDRVLQKTPISFDASIWELFLPLWSGARLVLARPGGHADPAYLVRCVQEEGITVLQLVPSMLDAFLRETDAAACSGLRRLFCGGEVLSAELRRRCHATLAAELGNLYGPTEAAIDATSWPCARDVEDSRVPIGRPLPNVQVHLVDRFLEPVPFGMEGEIFIGGAGLAIGYRRRPDLTAERFLPDPWSARPGARLYRTGDLGRRRPGGEVDYLGRADHQVKLRGYRIELEEIEQALLQHAAIRQVVVDVREDGAGRKRLVAWLVPAGGDPAPDELRSFLAERLPDYMIPASYVTVASLPRLPNGKLDRRSLPNPKTIEAHSGTVAEAPRSPVEARLTTIWGELLGRPQVGIHDNFFELGGDSILSIQVVSRARQHGIHLTSRQLFLHQTIAALAAEATSAGGSVLEEQGEVTGDVPLTPIQSLFFERDLADPHHFNQSLLLEVAEPLDPLRLDLLVAALMRHHDALRLRFERGAQGWRQIDAPPSAEAVGCAWIDLSALPEGVRRGAIERACSQAQASLDLARGPLARIICFGLGSSQPARLLLVIHHLAVDGVSWRILLEDLQAGHEQLRNGEPLRFPPKTTSFQRWAGQLTGHARSAALCAELADWLSALEGPVEPLPVDFPEGLSAATGATLEAHEETLTSEETRRLLEEVPRVYRTEINDVLLAALAAAFGQWTGVPRVLVDLEGHGREPLFDDVDVSRTIGWFTTVFPVRLDLSSARGPEEELKKTKERLRAVPNHGIGYGLLRFLSGEPEIARQLRELPRPEVSFNYLGRFDQVLPEASPYRLAAESGGAERSARQAVRHLLDVTGLVAGGQLHMRWTYSRKAFRGVTVEQRARDFSSALRRLIEHCRSPHAGTVRVEDFPLARLDQETLERLVAGSPAIEDIYPLAPLQQGLLAHAVRRPGGRDAYFRQLSLEVEGEIDLQAFSLAWQRVIERHSILRTRFHWQGLEEPLQVVEREVSLPLRLEDWRQLSPTEQEARWKALLAEEQERGFALDEAPLLRLVLISRGERRSYFLWSYHHLLLDGWSVPVLWLELEAVYAACRAGMEPELPAAGRYRDYIAWVMQQDLAAAERFWRAYLNGFTDPTPLPCDRLPGDRRGAPRADEGELHLVLSAATTDLLQSVGRRHHVTLNTLVQGAWALLLAHGSGERDVTFGIVSSGRPADLPGIETMMGLFVNTLPLRIGVRDEAPLIEWLRELQANQAEVRELEYTPLAQVRRWSGAESGKPLFESILAFENYPVARAAAGEAGAEEGWVLHEVRWRERTEYPLTLIVGPGSQLVLKLLYDPERFTAAAIERLKLQLGTLLAECATAPERPLAALSLLGEAERQQLCLEWNDTARAFKQDHSLTALFERQVDLAPQALAVVCGEERLSYGDLERRSNQLAHLLRATGLRHGELVAVHLSRGPQAIVALLAIHKAGGAYVPLDRNFPPARLRWILATTGIRCLVTQAERLEPLREVLDDLPALRHVVCVEPEHGAADASPGAARGAAWELWTESRLRVLPAERLGSTAGADDVAYIIFTSGSTGTPKGVMVRHRPVINLIEWVNRELRIAATDRVLFTSSLSFDLSVYDIFGFLAAGGTIHVATESDLRDPERLVALLTREPVTFWDSAPALLQQLVPFLPTVPDGRSRLRLVFLSGDWIPLRLPDAVRGAFPGAHVVSLGGATEATVWSNFYPVGEVDPRWVSIPYGRPIQNARYHVLDVRLSPCPIGVAGDLYIGGDCLAAGYAGEPTLSAEKFIPDPFGWEPGNRLYRTGDRARSWPDGKLEFLGRVDHQVKLRGFRIELGEIEAQLLGHPAVQAAVAVVREDQPGVRRLVAYVVRRRETAPPGVTELRDLLAARLQDYMVPAAFVTLATLPVTANGKLDRRALPPPEADRPELRTSYVAPRNPRESVLAGIWSDLLDVEQVGIHDHFLELGGDSILALQVVSRAQRTGLRITPGQLYEYPTIAELAPLATMEDQVVAEQGPVSGEVPLTPVQHWFFSSEPVDPHHFNQALMLRVARPLSPGPLAAAVGELVAHHDALRLRYRREVDGWRQRIAPSDGAAPVIFVDFAGLPTPAMRPALESAAAALQASLDLASGPLLRVALFGLGPAEPSRLLLTVHHLAIDGVSWRILLDDLATLYEGLETGTGAVLPAKTSSFKQWAERLAAAADSPVLHQEAAYWLSPAHRQASRLPVDLPGGRNTVSALRRFQVSLSAPETRALLREVPAVYRTEIQDLLLGALAQAFSAWTGERTLRVDLEAHGRDAAVAADLDVSRTVGWLTVIFPLLIDLSKAENPGEVIRSIKEQVRSVPGRGLAYGLLRYMGGGPLAERLREVPEAEVSFNYLGRIDQALSAASPFSSAEESTGPSSSRRQARRWLLQIEAAAVGEELRLTWSYSAGLHQAATIEHLADRFLTSLSALIRHCQSPEAGGFTPSDFPLARLDADRVGRIEAVLAAATGRPAPRAVRDVEDLYPLSPLQESMLLHTVTLPASQVSREQWAGELRGPLDVAAFELAWRQVIERHPSLRTAFLFAGLEEPLQVVYRSIRPSLEPQDWRDAAGDLARRLDELLAADREQGFDLTSPPLMRFHLCRTGEESWQFVWSHHHLVLDGWSRSLVLNEVVRLYEGSRRGEPFELPAAPPFRHYIVWLQRQDPAADEAFWRQSFAGCTGPTPLVFDRPDLGRDELSGSGLSRIDLSEPETTELETFARRRQITVSTLVQAAWALLLARYTDREEAIFGATVSGRPADLTGAEAIIGMLINNLPARVRVPGGTQVGDWLGEVQQLLQELRRHEHNAPAQIQEWSGLPWGQRLFETLVVFQNYPGAGAAGEGPEPELEVRSGFSTLETGYPVTLVASPGPRLGLEVSYLRRRFAASAVARMLSHLEVLLRGLAAGPERRLDDLLLLEAAEIRQMAADGASASLPATRTPYVPPRDTVELELVHLWEELFERRPLGIRDRFFELGGHSVLAVRLMARLRSRFGTDLPLATLFTEGTVEHLARVLRNHQESFPWSPLVTIQPGESARPLFCIHPAAGSVLQYRDLAAGLGRDRPIYGLQPLGERRDQQPLSRVEDMAAFYLKAIRQVQPRGPYLLAGWSFGGYVAFEMARQLVDAGEQVDLLAMLDTGIWPRGAEPDDSEHLRAFVTNHMPEVLPAFPQQAGLEEQIRYLAEEAKRIGTLPSDVGSEDVRCYFNLYMTNVRAAHWYTPAAYSGRVTVFRALEGEPHPDPEYGWGLLALEGVDIIPVPGSHATLLSPPHVAVLAESLRGCLERVEKISPARLRSVGGELSYGLAPEA